MKPIYKRKIWTILHGVAKELSLASDHNHNPQSKVHIDKAVKILDEYVLEDMKKTREGEK